VRERGKPESSKRKEYGKHPPTDLFLLTLGMQTNVRPLSFSPNVKNKKNCEKSL
jgi:hypothetical protein